MNRAQLITAAAAVAMIAATGCKRETRKFRQSPPSSAAPVVTTTTFQPGPATISARSDGPSDENAYDVSEGKTLFNTMNCVGCHSHGGGGMGPALMDSQWIYGSEPSQVFASIVEGRPNGMPAWRGKLTNNQVWQLVAYVRSLSGIGRRDVRSGRGDDMQYKSSEQNTQKKQETNSGAAPASEMP